MGTRNLRRRETSLHSELEALRRAIESMIQHSTCQRFETYCKNLIAMIEQPQDWPNFSTELEIIQIFRLCFSYFRINYFPRTQNAIPDSLARNDITGKVQLMGTRNLRRLETPLHSELETLRRAMESMIQHSTCQRFETYCKDLIAMIEPPQNWPNFSTELEIIQIFRLCFSYFRINYFPKTQNAIPDSLARNALLGDAVEVEDGCWYFEASKSVQLRRFELQGCRFSHREVKDQVLVVKRKLKG
ncbi:hypothetical protein F2Q70_00015662 [Brassica cretica]|uniref:RNase H type-1 domain-containing protein n=1 Tax=Brassica cretica TaxID=69181 RepID=A0A8S9HXP8_BRACR|nr:hypothetical protein F2Q70_00015662 [Brassica cretica]